MVRFESGYFDRENRKYIIDNMTPTRWLVNYIWSEEFMMTLDHFGCGGSFGKVAYSTRRQLIGGAGSRLIYVKDRQSGEYFCANQLFTAKPHDFHQAHIVPGGHTVIGEELGIRVSLSLTAPTKGYAELWKAEIENRTDKVRDLSIYAHASLRADYTGHNSYTLADWNEELGGVLYSHVAYAEPGRLHYEHEHLYFCSSYPVNSYTTSQDKFKGLYRGFDAPICMEWDQLPNNGSSYNDYNTTAVEHRLVLQPGETKVIYYVAGMAKTVEEAVAGAKAYLAEGLFEQTMAERTAKARETEKVFVLNSSNEYMDDLVTTWLKNQVDLGKTWARVYGCGFRDVMQDVAAFGSMDPQMAKKKILLCLSHQFPNGNTIRMFEPIMRNDYRDGAAWIPETVSVYLNESGDIDFLNEECPYFECEETGTVLDHIRRGMTFLTTVLGEHGLCLWGHGDWNDSTNAAGIRGKGESVWLSIAAVKALKTFANILRNAKMDDEAEKWLAEAEKLTEKINAYGWDKDHYIHGYNDDMKKVGAYESAGAKFYLNMQSWAVLADIATGENGHKLMDRVEEELKCDFGYVQCAPSYTKGDPTIGRTTYFVPGCVENGAVYNHGVTFKIAADCHLGRGDIAYQTIRSIMADNPALYNCGVEPYAVTNMYIGPENPYCAKFAPCSWITGTAGWMYRCITEYLLGVQADFNGLKLVPCIPDELDGAKISRLYRGATYNITIHKGSGKMVVDGQEMDGNIVPIFPAGTTHTIEVFC